MKRLDVMRTMHKLALLTVATIVATPAHAVFEAVGLSSNFCKIGAVRHTVVYVDDMMMIEGRTDWAKKLIDKLKASLAPGERVTVVQLSPKEGRSTEVWTACWPDYTDAQRKAISQQSYVFSKNPLDGLGEQQGFFIRDFGAAVSKVYASGKRPESVVRFSADAAPSKQILRGLASDEGRFSNSAVTVRAIIYSDMAENSDLGSVFKPPSEATINYAEKLGTHLRKSVFYVFGLGEAVLDSSSMQENAKAFWTRALRIMSASVGGIGADLNVPNRVPVFNGSYNVSMKFDGQDIDGKLSVLTDRDGNLVDSWLGFNRLSITSVTGTYRCGAGSNCKLEANTRSGLTSSSPTEKLTLSGQPDKLIGSLGIPGTKLVFPLVAARETR
jgi:hypothetical protein